MKRLVTLLMAASLTAGLCACSNPLKTATDVVESTTDTTVVLEDPSVAPSLVIYDANDNSQIALTLGAIYADWHYLDADGAEQTISSTDTSTTDGTVADAAATDTTAEAAATDTTAEAAATDTTAEAAATDTTAEAAATDTTAEAAAADTTAEAAAADTTAEAAAADTTAEAAAADTTAEAAATDTTADTTVENTEAILAAAYLSLPTLDVDDDSEIYYIIDTGATPDCMEQTSWKAEYIGDASADAMEIYTKLANFTTLPLKAGRVYQVDVIWEEENYETVGYWGTLTYMFITD